MLRLFHVTIPEDLRIEESEFQLSSFIVSSRDAETAVTYFPTLNNTDNFIIVAKDLGHGWHWYYLSRWDMDNVTCMDNYAAIRWVAAVDIGRLVVRDGAASEFPEGHVVDILY